MRWSRGCRRWSTATSASPARHPRLGVRLSGGGRRRRRAAGRRVARDLLAAVAEHGGEGPRPRVAAARTPASCRRRQRAAELADNLASSRELADDEHASQALREQLKAQLAVAPGEAVAAAAGDRRLRHDLQRQERAAQRAGRARRVRHRRGRRHDRRRAARSPGPTPTASCSSTRRAWAKFAAKHGRPLAAAAAKNADLVLLVVDGPLKAYEVELAERAAGDGEAAARLPQQRRLVRRRRRSGRWSGRSPSNCRGVDRGRRRRRAGRRRRRGRACACCPTAREERDLVEVPPDVRPLAKRMLQVVRRDGGDLLLANLLLQSRGLVDDAKLQVRKHLDERADQIITRYMWAAGGAAGINPIPLFDVAGGSAITLKMILDLARVYRQPLDADMAVKMLEQLTKNLIALVGGVAATPAVASLIGSLLKTVPGVGTLAGGLVQGLVQALVTRWIGNVFVEYLQQRNEAAARRPGRSRPQRVATTDDARVAATADLTRPRTLVNEYEED